MFHGVVLAWNRFFLLAELGFGKLFRGVAGMVTFFVGVGGGLAISVSAHRLSLLFWLSAKRDRYFWDWVLLWDGFYFIALLRIGNWLCAFLCEFAPASE